VGIQRCVSVTVRERNEIDKRGRERECWKRVLEQEQGLRRWGRERIINSALGARKPGKGSCLMCFIFV